MLFFTYFYLINQYVKYIFIAHTVAHKAYVQVFALRITGCLKRINPYFYYCIIRYKVEKINYIASSYMGGWSRLQYLSNVYP